MILSRTCQLDLQMTNYLLLVFPTLLLFVTFAGCTRAPKSHFSDAIWDKNQAHMLQASACLFVVLHHLTQEISGYGSINVGPITILSSMGILFTSLYFFFSGYGLISSYLTNTEYLKHFIGHRLPIILVPFFASNSIFVLVRLFYRGAPMNKADIIQCLLGYMLLNGNGWYIVEIFFLYLAFYFIFKFIKKTNIACILLSLFTLFLIHKGFVSGHDFTSLGNRWFMGEWWYNSTIVFIMGIWFARFKERVITFSKKHYRLLTITMSVLFIVSFSIEERVLKQYGYYIAPSAINHKNSIFITLTAQSILCLIFTYLVLLINMKIELHNKFLISLSSISIEIFLIHNLFLNNIFDFSGVNPIFMYSIVLICGISGAFIVHLFDKPVITLFQKLSLAKETIHLNKKRTIIYSSIVLVSGIIIFVIYSSLIQPVVDYKKEIQSLSKADIGDIVCFGRYETNTLIPGREKVEWLVLDKKDNTLMLISEKGLDDSVYFSEHKPISWDKSDLCTKLNLSMYKALFSHQERKSIIKNPQSGDFLSLLSVDEANTLFADNSSRQLLLTSAAKQRGANINTPTKMNGWDYKDYHTSWWWLRSDTSDIYAPIVSADGEIQTQKRYVNKPNGAIRPVVWIKLNK